MKFNLIIAILFLPLIGFADIGLEKPVTALNAGNGYLLCENPSFLSSATTDDSIQKLNSDIKQISIEIKKPVTITAMSLVGKTGHVCVAIKAQ